MKRIMPDCIPIIGIVIVLGFLWSYSTAFHAFDDDEFQHTNVARLMQHGQQPYVDFFEHHLVLYHGLTAPLFALGDGTPMIFVFRTLALLSGAATLIFLYGAGRRFGASPVGAASGVWLLGLTPMFLLKMTEARPEAPAMCAFAAGLWLLSKRADAATVPEKTSADVIRLLGIGLLAAMMALLSQKYVLPALALFPAILLLEDRRSMMWSVGAFTAAFVGYVGWLALMGVAQEAFELTVLLNLRWRYSFSPVGYATEMYLDAGGLVVTGALGCLLALRRPRWRTGAALGSLLAAAVGLILLVPVPYRQSFLPLLAVMALGSMLFCSRVIRCIAASSPRSRVVTAVLLMLLLGVSAKRVLPQHLSADNRHDIKRMHKVQDLAPDGPVFDGRRLMFWRGHIGYHSFMHEEILLMLKDQSYAVEVIHGLQDAGLPPVIRDYRVELMPDEILVFIDQHYVPTEVEELYVAGLQRSRLMPGADTRLEIPVDGYWRGRWNGGQVSLNSEPWNQGESVFLRAGEHTVRADGLVWDLRLERDYRK